MDKTLAEFIKELIKFKNKNPELEHAPVAFWDEYSGNFVKIRCNPSIEVLDKEKVTVVN